MTTHQLTDEQRRLLEDCRERGLLALIEMGKWTILRISEDRDGNMSTGTTFHNRAAYIPRAAVEAWLAEQDEREAEIERRLAGAISIKSEVAYFNDWEAVTEKFFVSEDFLFYRKELAAPTSAIPVPRERIRAALDRHRAEQSDHLRDATKMVHDDQSGDANEMIEPRRYPDEVTDDQLPWFADNSWSGFWTTTKRCAFSADIANYFRVSEWGESLAKIKAEVCAAELNAIWRREEEARRRDIAHGEALEEDRRRDKARRIAAFVKRHKNGQESWFWQYPDWEAHLNKNGIAYDLPQEGRLFIPRAELEAALLAAGVTPPEPEPVISPELRARLEDQWAKWLEVYVIASGFHPESCTPAQARTFLREKGIEVGTL